MIAASGVFARFSRVSASIVVIIVVKNDRLCGSSSGLTPRTASRRKSRLPTSTSWAFARLSATLIRRRSRKNPRAPAPVCGLFRTRERMTRSASLPWNESTFRRIRSPAGRVRRRRDARGRSLAEPRRGAPVDRLGRYKAKGSRASGARFPLGRARGGGRSARPQLPRGCSSADGPVPSAGSGLRR